LEKIAFFFIWSGLAVILLAFLSYYMKDNTVIGYTNESINLLGSMGEYIGGLVGSLWALAGVILFYETLKFQRTELIMQREELGYQRTEIMEQTNQYIIQNQTLITRKMEGTFFQLISLHNEIVHSLHLDFESHPSYQGKTSTIANGRYCFNYFYKFFYKTFSDNIDLTGVASSETEDINLIIKESFKTFFTEFQEDIGHYYRNLFNLALYVDKSKLNAKKFYCNLIRSLLSNYELVLLFYYCLSDYGAKMKILTEKYSLFVQLPENELLDKRHMNLFDKKAFEEDYDISIEETSSVSLRRTDESRQD
jgi:hypothetical protein